MNTECAMIVSAAIGAGASLLTLLVIRLFDARSEKRKEKERFFFEIYGRRLALYRKILKQIHLFSDAASSGPPSRPYDFGTIAERFIEFSDMGALVASPAAVELLNLIANFLSNTARGGRFGSAEGLEAAISFMTEHSASLRDRIREETCPALVDRHLFKLTGTRVKRRKPPRDTSGGTASSR